MADSICSHPQCTSPIKARGLCSRHYYAASKSGQLKKVSALDRFWSKVDKNGPIVRADLGCCWVWTASRHSFGYGKIGYNGAMNNAHRVGWLLLVGPIPEGIQVMHMCDNPPCVRIDHLQLGTPADNSADMVAKGRHFHQTNVCKYGHEFTPENTYNNPASQARVCRACAMKRSREHKRRQRAAR